MSELTKIPEMLGGRVKTLHPAIHGGILARTMDSDKFDMNSQGYEFIDYVVCNLYPFEQCIHKEGVTIPEAVEEIDIGGVTLLRAAAKNHDRVTVISDPKDYPAFIAALEKSHKIPSEMRNEFALKAFTLTSEYDTAISCFFRDQYAQGTQTMPLRYLYLKF